MIEPPCTERYARWCERSATQLIGSLLLDLNINSRGVIRKIRVYDIYKWLIIFMSCIY